MSNNREPGNAAALRAALEAVRAAFDSNDFGAMGDHPRSDVLDMADAVRRKVEAALSAPVRNCDRFATAREAVDAFRTHLEQCRVLATTSIEAVYDYFIDWLFAPAEGGEE